MPEHEHEHLSTIFFGPLDPAKFTFFFFPSHEGMKARVARFSHATSFSLSLCFSLSVWFDLGDYMWMPLFPINRVAKCSHAHARVFTNVTSFLHLTSYMFDYVYIIYVFVKFLDEPTVIICLSCHPGILSRPPNSGVLLYSTFHTCTTFQ